MTDAGHADAGVTAIGTEPLDAQSADGDPPDVDPDADDLVSDGGDTVEVGTDDVGTVDIDTEAVDAADAGVATTDVVPTDDDAPRDDVVIDLFARLRADTTAATDATDTADRADPADPAGTTDDADATVEADDAADADEAVGATDGSDGPPADASARDDATDVDELSEFERRDAELTPLIVSSARRLKRVLADEQNEVLDALRRNEPVRSLDALLPAADEHLRRYTSAIVDDVLLAANAGATSAGRSSALRKADAARAAASADDVLGEWITLPLRERLERCIADGDGDNSGITKRVRAVYREWKTQHIDDQLDDVFRAAFGHGAYAAFQPGTPVRWVSDPAREACADCNDNTLAGAVAAGETFPTGHEYAPAHLGCRCLLTVDDR